MALRESPFSNGFVEGLHALGWGLILPCFWFLDRLIAVCMSTSLERKQRQEQECYLHPLKVFFGSIVFFVLFVITAPIAFLGFLLWAPLQAARQPFSYHCEVPSLSLEDRNVGWEEAGRVTFGFVTANLCLLPDSLARFNNLGHTQRRAAAIGKNIVQGVNRPHIRIFVDSPSSCGTLSPSSSLLPQSAPTSYGSIEASAQSNMTDRTEGNPCADMAASSPCDDDVCFSPPSARPNHQQPSVTNSNQNSNQQGGKGRRHPPRAFQTLGKDSDVPVEVSTLFPAGVDIVCLEEVFDKRAAQKLTNALAPLFGHVLYDVGIYACHPPGRCSSFKFFNSGLFLASRYPILEAQYHCFPNSRGEDALAAKGLLTVKLQLGLERREKKMVGYFNCTHLHAPEGDGAIRCEQLNMITDWIDEFQGTTKQEDELVMFDVLCGDFNFDNCSPDDKLEQTHRLFEKYRDPCRAGPGKEKDWVIGTLLEQPSLYDEHVSTPENLQRTLEREELRKEYIAPPVPLKDTPHEYPEPGKPWVGRRIDYILYRESSLAKLCQTEVEEYTYVTQLAGLTDHIPVGLRLNVNLGSDDNEP